MEGFDRLRQCFPPCQEAHLLSAFQETLLPRWIFFKQTGPGIFIRLSTTRHSSFHNPRSAALHPVVGMLSLQTVQRKNPESALCFSTSGPWSGSDERCRIKGYRGEQKMKQMQQNIDLAISKCSLSLSVNMRIGCSSQPCSGKVN